jgi:hypothetical protein
MLILRENVLAILSELLEKQDGIEKNLPLLLLSKQELTISYY